MRRRRGGGRGGAARISGARDRFKIIPECFGETDLHPNPPAAALRTLNFPRQRGARKRRIYPLRTFSFFFLSPSVISFLRSPKKAPVILRGCFFSTRSPTPACASAFHPSYPRHGPSSLRPPRRFLFFIVTEGKAMSTASTRLFFSLLLETKNFFLRL